MSISELMRRMSELGAPLDAIALAVEAVEAERAKAEAERSKVEAIRAKDAARTRLYRERGGGNIPDSLRQAVYDRDGFSCVYCGSEDHLQCDHDVPVSKGGETTLENLVTACRVCNSRKRDRDRKYVQRHSKDTARTSVECHAETLSPAPPKDNIKPPRTPNPVEILREALSETTARDLAAHRKAKKSPLTAGAAKGLVKAFLDFGDPEAAAQAMMAQGWTGFKPEWMASVPARGGAPPPAKPEIRNPALRALQRISQKNEQFPDESDIFTARSGSCQRQTEGGSSPSEIGPAPGGAGPVLDLAAFRRNP